MAPPSSRRSLVFARCSIEATSPSFALYSATSSSPLLSPSPGTVARAAYSLANATQPRIPSRYVPAPTTPCPGRGTPVAMARTASSNFILSDSSSGVRRPEWSLILCRALFPGLIPSSLCRGSSVGSSSEATDSRMRDLNTELPSPPSSRQLATHEHSPPSLASACTCCPFVAESSRARSSKQPQADRYSVRYLALSPPSTPPHRPPPSSSSERRTDRCSRAPKRTFLFAFIDATSVSAGGSSSVYPASTPRGNRRYRLTP
mmetsp:Transcript_505/g.1148  ORF Transcript_505/g.1148 Transcript_505/m.1148 type:complete len:261 (-) Transcript_505:278-1060(-)